jgi:hypothetical protein
MQQHFPVTVQGTDKRAHGFGFNAFVHLHGSSSSSSLETAWSALLTVPAPQGWTGHRQAQCQQLEVSFLIFPCHRWGLAAIESLRESLVFQAPRMAAWGRLFKVTCSHPGRSASTILLYPDCNLSSREFKHALKMSLIKTSVYLLFVYKS